MERIDIESFKHQSSSQGNMRKRSQCLALIIICALVIAELLMQLSTKLTQKHFDLLFETLKSNSTSD